MGKRYIGVLLICALSVHVSPAQNFNWGVSLSASYHNLDYEEPLPWWDSGGLLFPSVMLRGELPMTFIPGPLGKKLFLLTGIRYVRPSSRVDWEFEVAGNEMPFTGKFSIRQHYLSLPLQLRLVIGRTPLYLLAGPEFGFLFSASKHSDTLTPEEFRSSQTENVGGDINTINISLSGGLGVRFSPHLRSFCRYAAGVRNAKKSEDRTVLDTDWRTKEIEIGIEFVFYNKKDP